MARIKGGLNAKKKHNRTLRRAAALIRAIHNLLNCLFLSFLPAKEEVSALITDCLATLYCFDLAPL